MAKKGNRTNTGQTKLGSWYRSVARSIYLPLLFILSLLFSFPYLNPGLPPTDDGTLMVIRASGFHESFMDGHLPVRWIQRLNENYGYPVTNFLYPLPFYLSEIFQIIGFSALESIKIVVVLTTMASVIGLFLFLEKKVTPFLAFVGATFSLAIPYRFVNLYDRGSIGEIVALGIIPFVFYFIERWLRSQSLASFMAILVSWALLIPAHNSLALVFSLVIVLYIIVSAKTLKRGVTQSIFMSFCVGLLSVWFWLPAIHDLSFTRAPSIQIANIAEHLSYGYLLLNQIGFWSLITIGLSLVFLKKTKQNWLYISTTLVVLVLQLPQSSIVWRLLALDSLIQFPFRLLSLLIILVPLMATLLLSKFTLNRGRTVKVFYCVLLAIIYLTSLRQVMYIQNQTFDPGYFEANFDSSTNQREFTPKTVSIDPTTFAESPYQISGKDDAYEVVDSVASTQEKLVQVSLNNTISLAFNTHYFPGWRLYIDDERVEPTIDEFGRPVVELTVPDRRNRSRTVQMVWNETPARQAANSVSLVAWIGLIVYFVHRHYRGDIKKTLGALAFVVIGLSLANAVFARIDELKRIFDPVVMEQRYLDSQWVNPDSKKPLGDHGLYTWAGWAYVHGENPTLINSEMPPLGKYLIGLGIKATRRPAIVGLSFSLIFLSTYFVLAYEVLKDIWLAAIPVALLASEQIFRSPIVYTMLDPIQLTFICLGFWAFIRGGHRPRWFIVSSLCFGAAISSKFYATGILLVISLVAFLLATKRWRHLAWLGVSLPLVGLVHLVSYWQYFQLGHSLRDYLGVQKWIFNFYRSGSPEVPLGSYWNLVFFNRWRVWWGPSFGRYYTLVTEEWRILWPVAVLGAILSNLSQTMSLVGIWQGKKTTQIPMYYVLGSWLVVYAAFLTLIGGWPHYMLLFLPFAYLLVTKWVVEKLKQFAN